MAATPASRKPAAIEGGQLKAKMGVMGTLGLLWLSSLGIFACGQSESSDRPDRVVELCRGHGGVVALEDEIVICRDQTSFDDSE